VPWWDSRPSFGESKQQGGGHNKGKIQAKLHRKTISNAEVKSDKEVPVITLLVRLSVSL